MKEKCFIKQQKVRFQHCDQAGIVFYPKYLVMLNDLVEDFFETEVRFSFHEMHPKHGVPIVNLNVDFRAPAQMGDFLTKSLVIAKIGNNSLHCKFSFSNQKQQLVIEGTFILVFITKHETGEITSQPWLPALRERLNNWC